MDLRSASFAIIQKELCPFFELAIERHPQVIDIRVKRGNVVTVRDYARRILIKARKVGIGKFTADQVRAVKPRLRIFYCGDGIAIAGIKQKYPVLSRWDDYKVPFEVMPAQDGRWVTIAIDPSKHEVVSIASMLSREVMINPVELRTKLTIAKLRKLIVDQDVQIFKSGRNIILWPRRSQ